MSCQRESWNGWHVLQDDQTKQEIWRTGDALKPPGIGTAGSPGS